MLAGFHLQGEGKVLFCARTTALQLTSEDRRSLIPILATTVNASFSNLSVKDCLAGLRPCLFHFPQETSDGSNRYLFQTGYFPLAVQSPHLVLCTIKLGQLHCPQMLGTATREKEGRKDGLTSLHFKLK